MIIRKVEAFPFRANRDNAEGLGTAGSPSLLQPGQARYRWAETYPVLYSMDFETALVRLTLEDGTIGWGESQAPVAPEVACTIIDRILAPVLEGTDLDPTPQGIAELWWTMYNTMRVRGQTGGFMLDAIAGIDIALWDCVGKLRSLPVSTLCSEVSAPALSAVPAYLSGLPSGDPECVRPFHQGGFDCVKIFFQSATVDVLLQHCDRVQQILGPNGKIAVDALWRLTPESARHLAPELATRQILFLESPLAPESALAHAGLARDIETPIAIGESYRTVFELETFFTASAMGVVQPDIGRTGITEALRIAERARGLRITVIPHVSIAMGPQLAAAIHFAAAVHCPMLEYNPSVLNVANRYLREPLVLEHARYLVPQKPGLGIDLHDFAGRTV